MPIALTDYYAWKSRLGAKPEPGAEIRWEGVPSAFTADPFLLTMYTETAKIQGLKTVPCTVMAIPRKK